MQINIYFDIILIMVNNYIFDGLKNRNQIIAEKTNAYFVYFSSILPLSFCGKILLFLIAEESIVLKRLVGKIVKNCKIEIGKTK